MVLVAYDGPLETGGVHLARSDDGGATFDQSKTVLIDPTGRSTQSVTIAGQTIYVAYEGNNYPAAAGSARLARSDDGGHTFAVQTIASDAAGPAILIVGDTVYLLYEGYSPASRVYFQRSEDRGATWSAPIQIPFAGSVGVSVDKTLGLRMISGVLQATFYDTSLKAQTTAHSSDAGASWVVEPGQAAIATGSMVVDGDALIVPLVEDGGGLYLSESTDFGATWTRRDFQVASPWGPASPRRSTRG